MPIIGSLAGASARSYGFALAAGSSISSTSDLIAITTGTVDASGATSVTLSSIPSTYKHLQIRMYSKVTGSAINDVLRFNGDTASNYSVHSLLGEGAGTAESFANTTQTYMQTYIVAGAGAGANTFGTFITDILDYTSTNKNKTIRQLAGIDNNGNGVVSLFSGLWAILPALPFVIIKWPFVQNLPPYFLNQPLLFLI